MIRIAKAGCRLGKRIEHRLQIEGRAADHLEHVGGSGLLLQRLTQFVEQPRVLDGDDGLSRTPSHSQRVPWLASQIRVAFASIAWNTDSSSPDELEMTRSTSEVAVCCSRVSASRFRASASSLVRWSSCFWRMAAVGPRRRAAVGAARRLTLVVFPR
jgi:hypothetical protein